MPDPLLTLNPITHRVVLLTEYHIDSRTGRVVADKSGVDVTRQVKMIQHDVCPCCELEKEARYA
jgi:hypothetical protein